MNSSVIPFVTFFVLIACLPACGAYAASNEIATTASIESSGTLRATTSSLPLIDRLLPETCFGDRAPTATIDMIMLHFSSDVIRHPADPFDVERVVGIFRDYHVSAHYLVDRDGRIYRLVDESRRAYHAGKGELPWAPERKDQLNQCAIGIEILAVGSERDMAPFMSSSAYRDLATSHPQFIGFTNPQYAALNALIGDIRSRHPAIVKDEKHVVSHEEYAPGRKTDPGETFDWSRLGLKKTGLRRDSVTSSSAGR